MTRVCENKEKAQVINFIHGYAGIVLVCAVTWPLMPHINKDFYLTYIYINMRPWKIKLLCQIFNKFLDQFQDYQCPPQKIISNIQLCFTLSILQNILCLTLCRMQKVYMVNAKK